MKGLTTLPVYRYIHINTTRQHRYISRGPMGINMNLEVQALTTYEVAPDGSGFRMKFIDGNGEPASLIIPTECLRQLALSMPKIVAATVTGGYNDPSIRVVHPVTSLELERAQDGSTAILTLVTPDNLVTSYAVSDADLTRVAEAVSVYELDAFP